MVCRHCAGSGVDLKAGFHSCHECDGTGVRTFVQQIGGMKQYVRSHCGKCKGRGKVANHECDHCHGKGVFRESKHLDVHVEKGMHHDDTVTLRLEGDQVPQAMPGDVVVHVKVKPHDVFRRRQDDLEMTLDISLLEALVGFDRQVTHLDGHAVRLHRTELVQPESVWRIAREGMPVRGTSRQYGDLLVYFNIGYPRALNATEKHLVSQFLAE
ncbi:TPA: hypothetical protein N0F65_008102 [Lagenidium giganteum]|uniref:CR-type domain-containing protein n=1 Tax=Lagenidium giganteum TaxID=4803 RepID=A0AAV2YYU0_9STRA|nr:TPA: hypothetical protein N0F65_008102 [Lagenidium giganteum]